MLKRKEKASKQNNVSITKVIKYGLKFNLRTMPMLFLLVCVISIFHGVFQGFSTFATQRFYDSVEGVTCKIIL